MRIGELLECPGKDSNSKEKIELPFGKEELRGTKGSFVFYTF